ncbi:hypothetical protein H2248_011487 [Termitomyces sp. 'cryptogamus']|nr:hypothetical protein H2248_011487 [Termitomyces sp. 'cryptogamus']
MSWVSFLGEISKEGVHFVSDGEAANGSILLCPSDSSAIGKVNKLKKPKKKENANADNEEEQASDGKKIKKEKKVKKEGTDGEVEVDRDEFKANLDGEGEEEKEEDEEEGKEGGKKHKDSLSSDKPSKKDFITDFVSLMTLMSPNGWPSSEVIDV